MNSHCFLQNINFLRLMFANSNLIQSYVNLNKQQICLMKPQQEAQSLNSEEKQSSQFLSAQSTRNQEIPRSKHMYIEQENIYGRFIPYLLLKDQLHSEIDSSGATALNHMCSHNSPFIEIYLSSINQNDPILNRPSKMGHTPLAVAGLYCDRQNLEALKKKGARDNGEVDYWAIQGANLENWSKKINPEHKVLIHWAAYNDLPEVLEQYYRKGAYMEDLDNSNHTPMDIAVINKSYASVNFLASIGLRPKTQIINACDSVSIRKTFQRLQQNQTKLKMIKVFKILLNPIFWLIASQLFFVIEELALILIGFSVWAWLFFKKIPKQNIKQGDRIFQFYSETLNNQINWKYNHIPYIVFNIIQGMIGFTTLNLCQITEYYHAFIFWIIFVFMMCFWITALVQLYGIACNLTHSQLIESYKSPHLWNNIYYIQERNILMRKYQNPNNKNIKVNLIDYLQMV